MPETSSKLPAVAWLKVTDYMMGWIEYELCGSLRVGDRRIVCVQHLKGARAILRMQTEEDTMEPRPVGLAMSATRQGCISAGLTLNPKVVEQLYGMNRVALALFVPIECPRMTLTEGGVLRPWNCDTCFSHKQASQLLALLREAFWQAVAQFADRYAREHQGEKYAQQDMIEDFCRETHTDDIHVPALRREWQRRVKRVKNKKEG